ncbi:response regulator [Algimonas porphyrae]|uniref:Response regulatory domain-containing protein n=1 Tax=Algimonas porphyrae TaxID=1128113 RepID=A0ABQ5UVX2_9PROT|nr:response regulator [Algimonas porphyrae]GLQ19306.1 hypothetical protein GCM10007854_02610 [Algimonas porphyrae]
MRVLIVDNSLANGLVARSILSRDGHHVSVATNGSHALQLVHDEYFDAALLDIVMPGLDGLDMARILSRSDMPAMTPALIALTAYNQAEDIQAYRDAGLQGLIAKPLRPGDLDDAMRLIHDGGYPLMNCFPNHTTDQGVRPLLDDAVITNGPGQADDITRERIWRHYRAGLSESLREISRSLPGTLSGRGDDRTRMLAALHGLRSASLMVGLDRAPRLADALRDAPRDQIMDGMAALLQAVRESLPRLEAALLDTPSSSVAAGEETGRMQVR